MTVKQEFVAQVCERMKEDCAALVIDALTDVEIKCGLSEQDVYSCVTVLTKLASDIVTKTVDMCIELTREVQR